MKMFIKWSILSQTNNIFRFIKYKSILRGVLPKGIKEKMQMHSKQKTQSFYQKEDNYEKGSKVSM